MSAYQKYTVYFFLFFGTVICACNPLIPLITKTNKQTITQQLLPTFCHYEWRRLVGGLLFDSPPVTSTPRFIVFKLPPCSLFMVVMVRHDVSTQPAADWTTDRRWVGPTGEKQPFMNYTAVKTSWTTWPRKKKLFICFLWQRVVTLFFTGSVSVLLLD